MKLTWECLEYTNALLTGIIKPQDGNDSNEITEINTKKAAYIEG